MEERGYVSKIIFRNEENGYTVFSVETKEDDVVCVGKINMIQEGEFICVEGEMEDSFHGPQLKVKNYEIKEPEDAVAIERYLASGVIKGIGASLAKRIVTKFGEETFRIVEEEPERLAEVKGISLKKAQEISIQFIEKHQTHRAMMFLQKFGIANKTALKVYQRYGEQVYQILQNNPYQLADEIDGIGFRTADEIAGKAGIPVDSDFRIKSAILHLLSMAAGNGHVYLPEADMKSQLEELLRVRIDSMELYLADLSMERKVVVKKIEETNIVYRSVYYYMELNCARMLNDLNVGFRIKEESIERKLERILSQEEIMLEPRQSRAVIEAVRNGIMILTGGPGTGKTTTINTMIRLFEDDGMEVLLAAPTGRAARRMKEATGCEAQTIHRLLGVNPGADHDTEHTHTQTMLFERDENNPLEADVIIIDEMSMVDIHLLHALLKAIVPGTRVIMVGDINQLPSVGPGNCLRDMIDSGVFPVIELVTIFRQAAKSDIVLNAHKINKGEYPVISNQSEDFFLLERKTPEDIIGVMLLLIMKKLPPYVKTSPYEIQVLTPMRKGALGVERLNPVLQEYLNPPDAKKQEKEYNGKLFREGDKVMQIKNNYQLPWEIQNDFHVKTVEGSGVYNGDIGIIRSISEYLSLMVIEFEDGKIVEYPFSNLEELELAYAITIHKSQGSEYPAVLLPVLTGPQMLFNRNLLYTAVTRAKRLVTIVGSREMVNSMVDYNQERKRFSTLSRRIVELNT